MYHTKMLMVNILQIIREGERKSTHPMWINWVYSGVTVSNDFYVPRHHLQLATYYAAQH